MDEKTSELVKAVEAYMKFFIGTYESPGMNAARNRVEKAIEDVKTETES